LFPFQAFQTADGWIMVACAKEKFWHLLVDAMGLDNVAGDERFANFESRARHIDELGAILKERFQSATTTEWVTLLYARGVPWGR